jgi:hypothetical protein
MFHTHLRSALTSVCALTLCLAVAPVAAASPPAAPTTQSASSGAVTATFTFTSTSPNVFPTKTLTISRSGQVVYDQPVTSLLCGPAGTPQHYCAPASPGTGQSSVHVVALEAGSEPNVVLDLYTGGAHCCWIEQVFSFDPATATYVAAEHDFGNAGERLKDLGHDGRFEFLTADNSFAYAFTDYADSGLPIQIISFAGGSFTDVTRSYPKLIAADAARYLKAFKHDLSNGVGLIAAWAADEDSLGHTGLVSRTLNRELRAGNLRSAIEPGGKKFLRALNKLLKKDGYVR